MGLKMAQTISPGARVAVIGAGAAGITASHLLAQKHQVTLFEKADYLGGHTNTLLLTQGPDVGLPIDTGFIVYNDRNYPAFIRLLESLNIVGQSSDMSFGFSSRHPDFEYSSFVPWGLLARPANLLNPDFYAMIRDILRFNRIAVNDLESGRLTGLPLGDYLHRLHFSDPFLNYYLIPMGAAIWSTPLHEMFHFPAESFVRFFLNHGLLALKARPHWQTIPGGSQRYVQVFRQRFSGEVMLNARIAALTRHAGHVEVVHENGRKQHFDYAVLSAHANESLKLLGDPTPDELRCLGAWEYTPNTAVLHCDASAMPRRKKAWASWNYMLQDPIEAEAPISLTYHMNRLQRLDANQDYFVTLNRRQPFPEEKIHRIIHYTHPKYTLKSLAAQPRLPSLNGIKRTYFCGSYFGYGFHEDAVVSALRAVEPFGVGL